MKIKSRNDIKVYLIIDKEDLELNVPVIVNAISKEDALDKYIKKNCVEHFEDSIGYIFEEVMRDYFVEEECGSKIVATEEETTKAINDFCCGNEEYIKILLRILSWDCEEINPTYDFCYWYAKTKTDYSYLNIMDIKEIDVIK